VSLDPTPLGPRQLSALLAVSGRELTWILPSVAHEVRAWRHRAEHIPDPELRHDALVTLRRERLNTEGAALFAILPRGRSRSLLRLLAAYQIMLDYLDSISERPTPDPLATGHQLHLALVEALAPGAPISDYYRHHPARGDGGYLRELVEACRHLCTSLPGFPSVKARAQRAAKAATVQILNHDPDPIRRDRLLAAWAEREFPHATEVSWFELTAAASSSLWILALLAFAAEPTTLPADLAAAEQVYVPWVCAASTLLDAFVDQPDDAVMGNHNYLAHYPSSDIAVARLAQIVYRSASGAGQLRRGTRHALITTGMVAMYLSKDAARDPALRDGTRVILGAVGSTSRVQLPIMRTIRALHHLRSA
jgi:tetraprenyl-beta-curcumene synthase